MKSWRNQREELTSHLKWLHHSPQFQRTRVQSLDRSTKIIKKNTIWKQCWSVIKELLLKIKIKFFHILFVRHITKKFANLFATSLLDSNFPSFESNAASLFTKKECRFFPRCRWKIPLYLKYKKILVQIEIHGSCVPVLS